MDNKKVNTGAPSSKAAALLARIEKQNQEASALAVLWEETFQFPQPDVRQFKVWLNLYDFDTVVLGLDKALQWFNRLVQDADESLTGSAAVSKIKSVNVIDIVKYASGCMAKHKKESEQPCTTA
jgi:hypothetical protein